MLCSDSVDDLKSGFGAEYVDVSAVTLVFCSAGYFQVRPLQDQKSARRVGSLDLRRFVAEPELHA